MKRLSSSDSLNPICPPAPSEEGMYGRGFSPMLDDLDDDDLCSGRGGGGGEKKRRLSVDQVRALEKNFEVENKLDPERKLRLALELGLQPRQVAVWFQNRRARWKTKQLERDYATLKANYDALRLDFDALRHDNKSLVAEIEELRLKLDDDAPSAKEEAEVEPAASESEIKAELEDPPALIYSKDGSSDSDSSAVVNDNVVSSSITTTGGFAPANSSWSPFAAHEPKAHKGGGHGFGFGFGFSFQQQLMKVEEHGFLAGDEPCSSTFFYDEQPPSFAWCGPDQWNWVDGGGDNNNIGRK